MPLKHLDYDPTTPQEIARADALDALDLASGKDLDRPDDPPAARPTPHPARTPGKIADLAARYRLRVGLFRADDAGPPPIAAGRPPRPRRPRTAEARARDAARKREKHRRRQSAGA